MSAATLAAILKLVDLALLGVEIAADVRVSYERQRSKLEAMVREGRGPTAEELAELDAEVDRLRGELHG